MKEENMFYFKTRRESILFLDQL